jgi:YYY domain-containing protein
VRYGLRVPARPGRAAAGLLVILGAAIAIALAHVGSGRALLLSPSERRFAEAHGTWHRMFDMSSIANRYPVLVWALALLVIGALGLPYVWLAARSLPDRGFAFARPLGLLLVGWLVWWLASAGVAGFSRGTIAVSALVVAAGGAAIVVGRREEFVTWLMERRRLLAVEEALFWSLFAAAVLVRWANPDLWHPTRGGEKPMDLAYLNAVVKSAHFPPYDPWFAGGQMNYYYFGFVLVAVLVKATSIVPYVAYNLAVPTFFAFLGTAAFGVTLGFVERSRARAKAIGSVTIALLGALFVAVVGNLGELRVVAHAVHHSIPNDWWYWNPSRVIHHPLTEPGPITEFPSFTYLFADLHAHAMALPYTAVALGLSVSFLRARTRLDDRLGGAARLFLLALVLGALWPLNTWDVPTYAVIALLAVIASSRLRDLPLAALRGAVLLALAYVLFLPFHRHYEGVFSGVARWHGGRTRVNDYLTIHGLFLFAITSAVVLDLVTARDLGSVARAYRIAFRSWDRLGRFRDLHRLLVRPSPLHGLAVRAVAGACAFAAGLALVGDGVPALAVGLATLGVLALVRRPRPSVDPLSQTLWQAALTLFLIGLALTVAVEFVVAKNIDVGRSNTVFKFYLQAWVLWSVAAAASVSRVYGMLPRLRPLARSAWRSAFVLLLAAAALYPILATRARVEDRFGESVGPTLDGLAFTRKAVLDDKGMQIPLAADGAAIRWILKTLPGSPAVAEVNTYPTLYGWGNRYAMFTGNPAVVGWDYHQRQQRPPQAPLVLQRIRDVQTAYATRSTKRAYEFFRRYGVEYFVVGPLERAYFPDGQGKWPAGDGVYWHVVYRNAGVQVYKLDR